MNGQGIPEDKVRKTLEGVRSAMFLRFGEKKSKRIVYGSLIGFACAIVLILVLLLVRINTIEVKGDEDPYLEGGEGALVDPWDNDYRIEVKGKRFVVISNGPDGSPNTEDDIRSDKIEKTNNR